MTNACRFLSYTVSVFCLVGLMVSWANADAVGEWRSYGSDTGSTKYLPLDQINEENVGNLRIAWRWNSPDNEILDANPDLWTMVNEATPLMIDGVLYTSTALSQVAAIDANIIQKPTKTAHQPMWALSIVASPTGRMARTSELSLEQAMHI